MQNRRLLLDQHAMCIAKQKTIHKCNDDNIIPADAGTIFDFQIANDRGGNLGSKCWLQDTESVCLVATCCNKLGLQLWQVVACS